MPPRALEVAQQRAHGGEVLLGQHLGRHHERALVPALHRGQQRGQRDHRLARPDVALQEPVHREGPGHVGHDHGQGPALRLGELVGQAGQEARHQRVRDRTGDLPRRHVVVQGRGRSPRRRAAAAPGRAAAGTARRRPAGGGPARSPSSDSGGWMARKASVRSHRSSDGAPLAAAAGRRSSPARPQRLLDALADLPASQPGLGRGRVDGQDPQRPAPRRHAGHHVDHRVGHLAACPGTRSTLPKKIASVPASSCLARQGWLKKTIVPGRRCRRAPRRRPRRARSGARRARADCTDASTAASSPTSSSETSAWRVRSM